MREASARPPEPAMHCRIIQARAGATGVSWASPPTSVAKVFLPDPGRPFQQLAAEHTLAQLWRREGRVPCLEKHLIVEKEGRLTTDRRRA